MKIVQSNAGRGKTARGFGMQGPRALIPMAALGVACSSLLGVEDLNPGSGAAAGTTSAGAGGSSASGGNGGTGGANGGSAGKGAGGAGNAGGAAGSGGKGGATGGSSGSGGSSGDSGEGGGGNEPSTGGSAGAGGSAGTAGNGGSGGTNNDPTVRGKVVNHLLHPVPNTPIWIGDATTTTDADGEFEFEDVDDTYDVKLVVSYTRYGNAGPQYGWIYEGLTRRDPTIQVYGGAPIRDSNFMFTSTNPPASSTATAVMTLGSEYGNYAREGAGAVSSSFTWMGPATITATAHGLVWETTDDLPTSYTSYSVSSSPFAFNESGNTPWMLDFTPNTVATDTISGSVVTASTSSRTNAAFVQFASGAVIKVAEQTGAAATANYSFLVPTLPTATITVMASEGTASFGAAALAHRSGVTGGQTTPALTIPTPPNLVAPPNSTTLGPTTMFSWNGTQDTYVWHAESDAWYEGIYVVTSRKTMPFPTFPNGFSLRQGDLAWWRVETHGDAETVDELAGDNGFADSFAPWAEEPAGPRRDNGTFAISEGRDFTMP